MILCFATFAWLWLLKIVTRVIKPVMPFSFDTCQLVLFTCLVLIHQDVHNLSLLEIENKLQKDNVYVNRCAQVNRHVKFLFFHFES